jgi:hypothetical protein
MNDLPPTVNSTGVTLAREHQRSFTLLKGDGVRVENGLGWLPESEAKLKRTRAIKRVAIILALVAGTFYFGIMILMTLAPKS